jgi:hypothetical protein
MSTFIGYSSAPARLRGTERKASNLSDREPAALEAVVDDLADEAGGRDAELHRSWAADPFGGATTRRRRRRNFVLVSRSKPHALRTVESIRGVTDRVGSDRAHEHLSRPIDDVAGTSAPRSPGASHVGAA